MSDLDLPVPSGDRELRKCPWCAESIQRDALKCRFCGSVLEPDALRFITDPWLRPREGRMLAGVCAGLAEQFGISVTLLRVAFVLGTFFSGGVFLVIYLALWLGMPEGDGARDR